MIIIEKLILFKAETSKADLINNTEDRIIAVLDEMALSAKINYNLNSNHTITVELESDLAEGIINEIGFKQIIKAKTLEDDYEYFILTGIGKVLDDRIEITGVHWLTEIVSKIFCDDLKPRGLNANLMLKHIVEGSEEYKIGEQHAKDIETSGNIDTLVSCNLWQTSLGDYLEDLQELYGNCEVRKKGFMLSLMDYVGSRETRYTVNYGENLISSTINEDYIITKGVLAKGYDGIRGNIVYSDKISSGITKVIEYPIRLREEGEEDEEGYTYYDTLEECQKALEDLAREEFETNKLDEIVITYDIEFLDLSTVADSNVTEKSYLSVGDVVNTKIDKYNTNINTRVVEMNYDVLAEEIEDVTLSNADIGSLKVPTLNSVSKEIENKPSLEEVTSTAKQEVSDFINSGFGGHVKVYNNEIYAMDSPKKENAVKCLRVNMNGLAGSTTGWQGPYNVAITVDGQIIADRITIGILKSLNGASWINMETGDAQLTGTVKSQSGDQFVSMDSGGVNFQDWHRKEQMLRIGSSFFSSNRDMNGITLAMPLYADFIRFSHIAKEDLTNGWNPSDKQYNFFDCWSSDQTFDGNSYKKGINMYAPLWINNNINITSNDSNSPHQVYNTTEGKLLLCGDNGILLGYRKGTQNLIRLYINETDDSNGCAMLSYGNWNFNGGAIKNANIVNTYANLETKSIAEVSALETNSTDNVRYVYKNITSKNNKIILNIPNEYVGREYTIVGVAKKSFGDYAIREESENRFIIETDREMTMNIEISIN